MHLDLLRLLMKSKDLHQKIDPLIKEHTVSKEVQVLINEIRELRSNNPALDEITAADISAHHHTTRAARFSKEQNEHTEDLLRLLGTQGTSSASASETAVLDYYLKLDAVTQIANIALEIGSGDVKQDIADIEKVLDSYKTARGTTLDPRTLFVSSDLSDLIARVNSPGLQWRLGELNLGAGPVRGGDLVLVAAAVESGKTTFLADQVSFMATQLGPDQSILWFNNEEHSSKVKLRIIQAALARTSWDVIGNIPGARADYEATMGGKDKIHVLENKSAHNHIRFIERVVRELKPSLIVIDQLDKVKGLEQKDKAEHARLGHIYNWARELAMDNDCVVIAASQVDTTGFNEKWIHMHQLRGSKVDKPGELDLLITIGKVSDPMQENVRFIHLPKNKLHGGPKSDEAYRHGYFEVRINPPIARYEGVL